MASFAKLKQVCALLEELGHGNRYPGAEHDQLYLLPPDSIDPNSEAGEKLKALGVNYSDDEGWYIFT